MKTTLELPDELMRRVKIRAIQEGRKLKDEVAILLERGMESDNQGLTASVISQDPVTGLPVILGGRPAKPGMELTPERVAEIELQHEIERYERSLR